MSDRRKKDRRALTRTKNETPEASAGSDTRAFSPAHPQMGSHRQLRAQVEYQVEHRGPIPQAAEMERYKSIEPTAPKIILDEFQKQATHRRNIEERAIGMDELLVRASIASEKRGTYCGLAIALAVLAASFYLVLNGHSTAGTILGTVDLVSLVAVFVIGRVTARREIEPENQN